MAKKGRERVDVEGTKGLAHNPFAALAGATPKGATPPPDAAPDAAVPAGSPFPGKLVVRREKKGRGGKTVTRVSGVAEAHRQELAGRLKKALGCGASLEGDDIVLLGSLVDRAADWLAAEGAKRVARSR